MENLSNFPAMSSRAADEIRSAIFSGEMAPGARVRQEELAAKLGISREPIRHALLMLEREGLVRTAPKRGMIVAPLERKMILDIYDLREATEPYFTARLATLEEFDPEPLLAIVKMGIRAASSGKLPRLIDLDLEFHIAIYEATGNRSVSDVMNVQFGHLRRAVHTILSDAGYPKRAWEEHERILKAVIDGKPGRARDLAKAHVKDARSLLAKRFSPHEAAGERC
jgi:DNA-binding GntR family transcriptional regulator